VVAPDRFTVTTPAGSGVVPIYVSADWSHPLPGIRRVVIMVHGVGRNADSYFRSVLAARDAAGADPQTTLRGTNYFAYLKTRYRDGFAHRLALVPGVAHQGRRMFTSACGLAALFDHPGCPGL
jgi:hypothetical protein